MEKSTKISLATHIGECEVTINDKVHKVEMLIGAISCSPILRCNGKEFRVTWNDILDIAIEKGFFTEPEEKLIPGQIKLEVVDK